MPGHLSYDYEVFNTIYWTLKVSFLPISLFKWCQQCTMVELSESETAALEYVHILERYYPLQSYDQAFELHSKDASSRYVLKHITFVYGIYSI